MDELTLSIGDLARRTGVDIPTLRRWERYEGLLAPGRTPGGQRRYGSDDIAAVHEVLALIEKGWPPPSAAKVVAAHRDTGGLVFDASIFDAVPTAVIVTNAAFEILYVNSHLAGLVGARQEDLEGNLAFDFVDEGNGEKVRAAGEDLQQGKQAIYEVEILTAAGEHLEVEVQAGPLVGLGGRYRGSVGVLHDLRRQRRAERERDELRAQLERGPDRDLDASRSTGSHAVIAALTQSLLLGEPPDAVVDTAVTGVRRALDADHVAFVEVVRPTAELAVVAAVGESGPSSLPASGPFGSHVTFAVQSQRPIVVNDFDSERRFDRGPLAGEQSAKSGVCVPVRWRPEGQGALSVHCSAEHRRFGASEVTFIQSAANVCALALQGKTKGDLEETL
jgi:PAS domain S-box-containing protein